jgi:hypothetical protein
MNTSDVIQLAGAFNLRLDEALAAEVLPALTSMLAQGEQVVRAVIELDAPIPAPVFAPDA